LLFLKFFQLIGKERAEIIEEDFFFQNTLKKNMMILWSA